MLHLNRGSGSTLSSVSSSSHGWWWWWCGWCVRAEDGRTALESRNKFKERQRQDEVKLKEKELDLKSQAAEREEKYKESPAVKLKLWGDALRNTITNPLRLCHGSLLLIVCLIS